MVEKRAWREQVVLVWHHHVDRRDHADLQQADDELVLGLGV